jgi:hypothetical protein
MVYQNACAHAYMRFEREALGGSHLPSSRLRYASAMLMLELVLGSIGTVSARLTYDPVMSQAIYNMHHSDVPCIQAGVPDVMREGRSASSRLLHCTLTIGGLRTNRLKGNNQCVLAAMDDVWMFRGVVCLLCGP